MPALTIAGPRCTVCASNEGEPTLLGWRCACGRLAVLPERPESKPLADILREGATADLLRIVNTGRPHPVRDLAVAELRRRRLRCEL